MTDQPSVNERVEQMMQAAGAADQRRVLAEVMDPRRIKSEHEWVAAREIDRLNARVAQLEKLPVSRAGLIRENGDLRARVAELEQIVKDGGAVILKCHAERDAAYAELDRVTRGTWSKELARLSAENARLRAPEPPAAFRQIGVKQRSPDGRTEFLWWGETPPEGASIWAGPTMAESLTALKAELTAPPPSAWIRGHMSHTPDGHEYDEEVVPGRDRPSGDNWVPLYTTATEPPSDALRVALAEFLREQWERIAPVPRAQPGSYARGYDGGLADALRGFQAVLDRASETKPGSTP